ncbi:LicD family protein [Vibrio owensii]|uniref:LicD family protein n=1 Tax=Vibrio owensii TaxID=696485 RepID=UPI003CE52A0B
MKLEKKNNIEYYTREGLELHQEYMCKLLSIFSNICFENNIDFWLDGGSLLGLVRHDGMIPWDDDIDICMPYRDYVKFKSIMSKNEDSDISLYYQKHDVESWCDYFCTLECVYESMSGFIKPVKIDILPVKNINRDMLNADEKLVDECASVVKGKGFSSLNNKYSSLDNALTKKKRILAKYHEYMEEYSDFSLSDTYIVKAHGQFSPIKRIDYKYVYPLRKSTFCGIEVNVPVDLDAYLKQSYGKSYMDLPSIQKRKPTAMKTYLVDRDESLNESIKIGAKLDELEFYLSRKWWGSLYKFVQLTKVHGIIKSYRLMFNYFK